MHFQTILSKSLFTVGTLLKVLTYHFFKFQNTIEMPYPKILIVEILIII